VVDNSSYRCFTITWGGRSICAGAGLNIKNVILIALALTGGALFLLLQKQSKEYGSSFEQSTSPVIDKQAARYRAPDFTLIDIDNNEFKLSDAQGDAVVMTFWTSW